MPRQEDFSSDEKSHVIEAESDYKASTLAYRTRLREALQKGREEDAERIMKARQLEMIINVGVHHATRFLYD